MQPSALAKRVPFVLLLVVIAFYFYGLGHLPLVGPDEPRYAQVAREMLLRRDLITPTLGSHIWFEKPVLLYWLMMFSYKLFGVSEQAARLGTAVAGVLTVAAVYWLARRVEAASREMELTDFGLWSALATATTLSIMFFSRAASFDILVTMTCSWALAFFFAYEIETNKRRQNLFLAGFYVFVGLSLLAKGLVGLLPFAVVGFYFLLRLESVPRRFLISLTWGIPLTTAIAAIWYGPVIARHGRVFIDQFIIQHHFARYFSNKYHHPQSVLFYLEMLLPLTLPWTPFFLHSLLKLRHSAWREDTSIGKLHMFSLAWLLLPILVFSFSRSKLPGYILPVVPAAALLAGESMTRFRWTRTIGLRAMRTTGVLAIIFAFGWAFYARRLGVIPFSCTVVIATIVLLSGILACLKTRMAVLALLSIAASTVLTLAILLNCGVAQLADRESVKRLIQIADSRGYSQLQVCALHTGDQTPTFYASGRLIYGSGGEPAKFEGVSQVLDAARTNDGAVLVIVPLEYVSQLTDFQAFRSEVLGDNGNLAIVVVHLR